MIVIFNLDVEDRNFYYLSGIEEPCRGVLVMKDRPVVLASPLEAEVARRYVRTLVYGSREEFWELLSEQLGGDEDPDLNFSRLPVSIYRKLQERGFKKFNDVGKQLLQQRMVKTHREVEKLRRASRMASKAVEGIRDFLRPGLTELEVKAELEYIAGRLGAEGFSFDTIVASGPNSAVPHATASGRKLERGDAIVVDFGPTYRMYTSDITRTFVLGRNREFERTYSRLLAAQEMAIEMLEGGVDGKKVQEAVEKRVGKMPHSLGHGVGLDTHELPGFSGQLVNGTVFTVEPGVYGKFGVRIEDVVWLDGKAQVLTDAPKELDFAVI